MGNCSINHCLTLRHDGLLERLYLFLYSLCRPSNIQSSTLVLEAPSNVDDRRFYYKPIYDKR